ncbi:MAG: 23S rRNA (adenine(2503)-C2)-methyltransferase [delta proteobacterium MLS_D]|jgi:23S rRNA (adenine2503-C2)-methyltransferase|nr:MAG: 23S rRNA (adenine(2503)-C2)-methyltransferase [delta proteobacterium MLS_D]
MQSRSGFAESGPEKTDLTNLTPAELKSFIQCLGKERFRARQLMKWIYQAGSRDIGEMTNLSREFREDLDRIARVGFLPVETIQVSADGTKKALFRLADGETIETVLIQEKNHWTVCVSTQAGCAMGCAFCLTGASGFRRNLLPSEIAGQVTALRFGTPEGPFIKNVVLMGMGEPLLNYDNTLKAIDIMTSDVGLDISKRRITVSTCGITPMIRRLGKDLSVNLALSLNAPDDETRNRLMPINKKYPLADVLDACRDYPMPLRRRITMEYILIRDVNDSPEDAEKLARLVKNVRCKFNLIAFNEHPGSDFKTSPPDRVDAFRDILVKHNYTAVVRKSKGRDILAACGQLRGRS